MQQIGRKAARHRVDHSGFECVGRSKTQCELAQRLASRYVKIFLNTALRLPLARSFIPCLPAPPNVEFCSKGLPVSSIVCTQNILFRTQSRFNLLNVAFQCPVDSGALPGHAPCVAGIAPAQLNQ
jgi:hypothetical protein